MAGLAGAVMVPVALAASAPVVVLSGLDNPGFTSVAPDGTVYFVQSPGPAAATLWKLAPDAASPTQVFSVSGAEWAGIDPIDFDRAGDVYLIARSGTSATPESALVQLDRRGTATTLYRTSWPSYLDTFDVTPSGRVYVMSSTVNDDGIVVRSRVLRLHGQGPPTEVVVPTEAYGRVLAVSDTGVVYVIGRAEGLAARVYEIRGKTIKELAGPPVLPFYLALDRDGNLFALSRTFNGSQGVCATESTTFRVLRYAAAGNGVSVEPSVASEGALDGHQFVWVYSHAFRVGTARDVYFDALRVDCAEGRLTGRLTASIVRADMTGLTVLDSQLLAPLVPTADPGVAVDASGRLWIAWATRGTLERIDP